jgi:hypothetical protein
MLSPFSLPRSATWREAQPQFRLGEWRNKRVILVPPGAVSNLAARLHRLEVHFLARSHGPDLCADFEAAPLRLPHERLARHR